MFFLSIFGGSEFTALPDAFRKYATISQYEYTRRLNKRSTKPYTTIQTFYTWYITFRAIKTQQSWQINSDQVHPEGKPRVR